jgi:hypothetical protein
MQNVDITVSEQGKLVIEVDLTEQGTRSASGKTTVIGSTRGNARVETGHSIARDKGDVFVGLNVYRYPN